MHTKTVTLRVKLQFTVCRQHSLNSFTYLHIRRSTLVSYKQQVALTIHNHLLLEPTTYITNQYIKIIKLKINNNGLRQAEVQQIIIFCPLGFIRNKYE